MKILALMKRFATNTNRDQIADNFGREVRLLSELAGKHDVTVFAGDHRLFENKVIELNGMKVIIVALNPSFPGKFLTKLNNQLKKEKYDWLIATSDAAFGAVGYMYARMRRIRFAYDLRDNYETYDDYNRGLKSVAVKYLHKKAIKEADLVSCVSEALREKISRSSLKKTIVVENGIELDFFKPMSREASRKKLGLPLKDKIICYVGHISREKGVDVLIEAVKKINIGKNRVKLLLSGKVEKDVNIKYPWVIFRGLRQRKEVVAAINAADVCVLPNTVNEFTKYCFPYKLFEYMACNKPIVATKIGAVAEVLAGEKESLCRPNDAADMADKIMTNINKKSSSHRRIAAEYTWRKLGEKLEEGLADG